MAYVKRDQPRTNANLVGELQRDLNEALDLLHKRGLELSTMLAINARLDGVAEGLQRENHQLRLDLALAIRRAEQVGEGCRYDLHIETTAAHRERDPR